MTDRDDPRIGGPEEAGLGRTEASAEPSRGPDREGKRPFDMEAWWEERSLAQKILLGIGFGLAGITLLVALGWVVMALWNWLVPELFGLKRLGYWQAWGLLVLGWILFKGARCGSEDSGHRSDGKRRRHLHRCLREDASQGTQAAESPQA